MEVGESQNRDPAHSDEIHRPFSWSEKFQHKGDPKGSQAKYSLNNHNCSLVKLNNCQDLRSIEPSDRFLNSP